MLAFPQEFVRKNAADPTWLRALPELLDQLAQRWSLVLAPHFPNIGWNYVAPAQRADGTQCVLKLSRYLDDTRNEIAALGLWNGDGAAQLLESAPDVGALLLERLTPGTMLTGVAQANDDAATLIAARLLNHLWRPAPEPSGLRSLGSWSAAFDHNRAELSRGAGGFPASLFQRADALRRELLASAPPPMIPHGDFHHYNILRAQRADWLAIDPKGLVGDRCFDICQFLRNPHEVAPRVNRRRLDLFCAELGLDRRRTKDWCFVHAMLNACWNFEEGHPWQGAVAYAEATLSF